MREERRKTPRWRVEYIANLVSDDNAPRYCVVTEMSDGGVRVHAIEHRIPDEFVLRLTRHGYAKAYRVIWRSGRKIGAELIGPVDSIEPYRSEPPGDRIAPFTF